MSDWHPIETAPKGQHILFFPRIGGRNPLAERVIVDRHPYPYTRKPTHWMPLPDPPTKETP